jgi:RNA polymerase sigma-70 factor (ECF subfamily)
VEDQQIIDLYFERNGKAIQETSDKYGAYCYAVSHRIVCDHGDAEECVNDTWLRAWNAIPPSRPNVFRQFLAKITRNLSFDRYRANQAKKRGNGEMEAVLEELEECIAGTGSPEEALEAEELKKSMNQFIQTLPSREGDIFLRRYYYVEPTSDIAKRYAMKESNVLTILSRTRTKLKSHLIKEGYCL